MENQGNNLQSTELVVSILQRANQKLSAKIANLENDVALAHSQIEVQHEQAQQQAQQLQELKDKLQQLESSDE